MSTKLPLPPFLYNLFDVLTFVTYKSKSPAGSKFKLPSALESHELPSSGLCTDAIVTDRRRLYRRRRHRTSALHPPSPRRLCGPGSQVSERPNVRTSSLAQIARVTQKTGVLQTCRCHLCSQTRYSTLANLSRICLARHRHSRLPLPQLVQTLCLRHGLRPFRPGENKPKIHVRRTQHCNAIRNKCKRRAKLGLGADLEVPTRIGVTHPKPILTDICDISAPTHRSQTRLPSAT